MKIYLSLASLGFVLLLISSEGNVRNPRQRKITLAALLGIVWAIATAYGYSHLGILYSLAVVNVFYFVKGTSGGIGVALLLSFLWPQGLKTALGICGILFIGFNAYGIMHFDLRHFADCPRAFYSINALLIGIAVTLAIFLWLNGEETKGSQSGNDEAASVTQPFQI
jgi:hypothetical protein